MVSICAISDTHGAPFSNKLFPAKVLCLIGDMAESGESEDLIILGNQIAEVMEDYDNILYVPGNHELKGRDSLGTSELLEHFHQWIPSEVNILLDDSWFMQSTDTLFHGIRWRPKLKQRITTQSNGRVLVAEARRDRLSHLKQTVPEDVDVLLSHIPPRNLLSQNRQGKCLGDWALRELLNQRDHEVVLAGHAHEHGGKSIMIESKSEGSYTTVYNCSFLTKPSTFYTAYSCVVPASNRPHLLRY